MEFEKYQRTLPYSYIFGAFGTIELLKNRPEDCLAVLIDPSFAENEAYDKILSLSGEIPVIIDEKRIDKIRDKKNIYVIGVVKKYSMKVNDKNHHIVLQHIKDEGTIGTIIRSMSGFDFHDLILIDCIDDYFAEHLLRSAMGAFFQVSIEQFSTFQEYVCKYPERNYYEVQDQEGEDIRSLGNLDTPCSFLFADHVIVSERTKKILIRQDLAIENRVNIILFFLYRK